MGYRIGIYDRDGAYIWGLTNYINEKTNLSVRAYAFTYRNKLEEAVDSSGIDMVFSGEYIDGMADRIPVVYMSEDIDVNQGEGYIYKYSNMRDVVSRLMDFARKKVKKDYGETSVYAVFSPLGRCGKTTLAKEIVRYYGNSIYLGAEEYMPYDDFDWREDISYYITAEDNRLLDVIRELPLFDRNTRYMYLADTYEDMRCITGENLRWFIKKLNQHCKLNCIVFDMGQAVLGDWSIMEIFDKIYVPVLPDDISCKKLEYFKISLKRKGYEKIVDKLEFVNAKEAELMGRE